MKITHFSDKDNETPTAPPSAKVRVMPDGAVLKKPKGENTGDWIVRLPAWRELRLEEY